MFFSRFVFVCALFVSLAGAAYAQSVPDLAIVPLTVDEGFPIQVVLSEKLSPKENEPVRARVVEPVYAFDREVIPSGAEVRGRITGFSKTGVWKRVLKMVGGDFTPIREPQLTFDQLILPDGTTMALEASTSPEPQQVMRLNGEKDALTTDLKNQLRSTVGPAGKGGLKDMLLGMAPYHPQFLPPGMRFKLQLREPLQFGAAAVHKAALDEIGSAPEAGSLAWARVTTAVDSRTAKPGTAVEAVLVEPLFSLSNRVVFPAGSKLRGQVEEVRPARKGHRNGELGLRFTSIALPASLALGTMLIQPGQEIEGTLAAVRVSSDMNELSLNPEGDASIVESKKRFISPAMAFLNAGLGLNAAADPFGRALSGAYISRFLGGAWGNDIGLGIPTSILGSMFPPVGIGLRFFSAARALFSNFLARGRDIVFPADTLMEIRIENAAR